MNSLNGCMYFSTRKMFHCKSIRNARVDGLSNPDEGGLVSVMVTGKLVNAEDTGCSGQVIIFVILLFTQQLQLRYYFDTFVFAMQTCDGVVDDCETSSVVRVEVRQWKL